MSFKFEHFGKKVAFLYSKLHDLEYESGLVTFKEKTRGEPTSCKCKNYLAGMCKFYNGVSRWMVKL
jgi:hypothetical protein